MRRRIRVFCLAVVAGATAAGLSGCADLPDTSTTGEQRSALVYGADDRAEAFEVTPTLRQRMSESMVALVPRSALHRREGGLTVEAVTWGEADGLCPGERFAEQPAAAFCTGVLVDWDLVLTAGHCVRVFALQDFAVVFDYAYLAPGVLAPDGDVLSPIEVVAERLDPAGNAPRFDYAFVRLNRAADQRHRPTPLYVGPPPLGAGDPLVAMGAGGGVPLKIDSGGTVRDTRPDTLDYFVADTDTTKGASGGSAFDRQLALVGVLGRGGADLERVDGGCNVLVRQRDGLTAAEQFTYSYRAIEGLCAKGVSESSLCRASCGVPCEALPPVRMEAGGCAVAAAVRASDPCSSWPALLAAATVLYRTRRRRSRIIGRRDR